MSAYGGLREALLTVLSAPASSAYSSVLSHLSFLQMSLKTAALYVDSHSGEGALGSHRLRFSLQPVGPPLSPPPLLLGCPTAREELRFAGFHRAPHPATRLLFTFPSGLFLISSWQAGTCHGWKPGVSSCTCAHKHTHTPFPVSEPPPGPLSLGLAHLCKTQALPLRGC